MTLYRTRETSPELLKTNPDEVIQFLGYENYKEMYKSVLDMLKSDLEQEQLLPRDIMIIDMDTFESVSYTHLDVYKRQIWYR